MTDGTERSPLNPSNSYDLPFFAYGIFKPTELAYGQLEGLVERSQEASVTGSLLIRDGFAVYGPSAHGRVRGVVLWFREGYAQEAYARICEFEPNRLYKWIATTTERGVDVNLVAGRGEDGIPGAVAHEYEDWSLWRDDPMFRDGTRFVIEAAEKFAGVASPGAPPDQFRWDAYFELQMLHMFAWTILERYVAMRFGPRTSPSKVAERLGQDGVFARALTTAAVTLDRELYDTRGGSPLRFSPDNPVGSAKYLYQLRSNVVHRGKAAYQDAELLRSALLVLTKVLQRIRTSIQP